MCDWIDVRDAIPEDGELVWVHLHTNTFTDKWTEDEVLERDEVLMAVAKREDEHGEVLWSVGNPVAHADFDLHSTQTVWEWGEVTDVVEWMPVIRPRLRE